MRIHSSLAVVLVLLFAPSTRADPPKVSVGVITALSGGMSTIGTAVRNGIELARHEHPELFTRAVFHYEDDQFDAKKSIAAYQKLRNVDRISVLFGFGVVLGHSLAPLVERDQIPLINFTFEVGPAVGRNYVIRAMNHTAQYQKTFAAYMKQIGVSRFTSLRTEIPFFTAMATDFRDAMGTAGDVHDIGVFNPTESDFRAVIPKLRGSQAPIGLFLLPEQIIQFSKQAKELGLQPSYFGTDLFESAAAISSEPEQFEGALYPDNEPSSDFRTRYRNAYGDEVQLTFAGSAYDMSILLGEILRDNSNFNAQSFLRGLQMVREHPGVLGTYNYRTEPNLGGFFEYPIHVKKIMNGHGVPVSISTR